MKEKWLAIVWISGSYIGIILEATNQKEAKFLAQALIARKYPTISKIPVPTVAPLVHNETDLMNPSER